MTQKQLWNLIDKGLFEEEIERRIQFLNSVFSKYFWWGKGFEVQRKTEEEL
jgi:hypothetical protein